MIARPRLTLFAACLLATVSLLLLVGVDRGIAASTSNYTNVVFSDGFESGSLGAWTAAGTGSVTVSGAAAHSGSYGAQLTNSAGQFSLIGQKLSAPLTDSSVSFWAKVGSGGGIQTLAQARDQSSSQIVWGLLYDGNRQGLYFYPYQGATSTEIFTGAGSVPTNTWFQVEVQYTATSSGGAQLYVNGQTQPSWGVSGDYARANNFQKLQLWNDGAAVTDFDDVTVATPAASSSPTPPGTPTGVSGTAGNGSVSLSWSAPASDGGSAITGYRVTPYVNGTAQAPIPTGSTNTSYTVSGLTNGTAYTFTVAAINAVGTGPDSTPSPALTPVTSAGWTTYRGDAARSGVDLNSGAPVSFASAWSSQNLGGDVYAEPLVYKGLVFVATENNDVYALNESTGQVVWHATTGTPVPSTLLPCGNISPTVGITSTPVIDPATNQILVVADTWDGSNASSIAHRLYAFNVADGSTASGFPEVVDPPGSIPADQLQRTALALDASKVIIGYGGNNGDCGTYHGWLVAAPESGGQVSTFQVDAGSAGGAIWGSGDGAAVDSSGNLWVATGNGFGSGYGYQESVLKLDSNLNLLDHWAPSNWSQLDASDIDLGSTDPLLLPDGLVFQIGKAGVGYLLSAANLGGTGASPLFQAQVCGLTSDASFGGAVYYDGVIYVACADGLRALALNTSTQSFTPVPGWQVHSAAIGPPIVSGGLVWVTGWNSATLYGLGPQTGAATVTQSTPAMEHFTTPSAADGMLFLATGQTVEAYTIAK